MNIYSEYKNYRWIDLNKWSAAKEVDALVTYMVDDMGVRKKTGYEYNMKTVIIDLYQSYLADPEQYIAYNRSKEYYSKNSGSCAGNRYIKNPHVTYTYLTNSIDYLDAKGYINNNVGGYFRNETLGLNYGYVSRMRANDKLTKLFKSYGFEPDMISNFDKKEVIILRSEKVKVDYEYNGELKKKTISNLVEYKDNSKTKIMRKLVENYNKLLERTRIDVDIECISNNDRNVIHSRLSDMKQRDKRIILRMADKSVRRVFNNNSFEEGGRFYGAWWIGAPSIVRKYITINGAATIELDYSGVHIHLLYALKGINYANLKQDPYELSDDRPDRELNKLILLTALNAIDEKTALSSVFNQLRKEGKLSYYKISNHDVIRDKLKLLKEKHKLIADEIANNYGIKLQYHDSCVISEIIDRFTKLGIPVLTVHDSVICQSKYVDIVKHAMWTIFMDKISRLLNTKLLYATTVAIKAYGNHIKNKYAKYIRMSHMTKRNIWNEYQVKYHNCSTNNIYGINSIIKITDENRDNVCNKMFNHTRRVKYKQTIYKNITIKLREIGEDFTSYIDIR